MVRIQKSKQAFPKNRSQKVQAKKLLSNMTDKDLQSSGKDTTLSGTIWHKLTGALGLNSHPIKMEGKLHKSRKWEGRIWTHDKPKCKQKHMAPWSKHNESSGCCLKNKNVSSQFSNKRWETPKNHSTSEIIIKELKYLAFGPVSGHFTSVYMPLRALRWLTSVLDFCHFYCSKNRHSMSSVTGMWQKGLTRDQLLISCLCWCIFFVLYSVSLW